MTQKERAAQNLIHTSNPEFIRNVLDLYNQGYSVLAVGRQLGTSHTPVRTVLHANGIATTPKKHWKNGQKAFRVNGHGYIERFMPEHPNACKRSGYVKEHIYVISQKLGRGLYRGEVVHHRNGDRQDNRIENLELLSRREHSSHHQFMSYLFMRQNYPHISPEAKNAYLRSLGLNDEEIKKAHNKSSDFGNCYDIMYLKHYKEFNPCPDQQNLQRTPEPTPEPPWL